MDSITPSLTSAPIKVEGFTVWLRMNKDLRDHLLYHSLSKENVSVTATDEIPAHLTALASKHVKLNDLYACIAHHRPSGSNRDQTAVIDEEVQYAMVHHYQNTKNNKEDAESHYGNISINCVGSYESKSQNAGTVALRADGETCDFGSHLDQRKTSKFYLCTLEETHCTYEKREDTLNKRRANDNENTMSLSK
ncbi:hypothetical protein E1301_Tti017127 [Triplophysa tibetana]|uniref:Uncharacterized protein n=1 Tax=Triplophysa tibetana TaxID=1572043 RepID=A0A5A9PIC5_9TELE|nr:hypothetical protein E1301_Tti017127 [Triplophysa tibetana]